MEIVEAQRFDVERIAFWQEVRPGIRPGVYITSQRGTAVYFATLPGERGIGGGPGLVRITVPRKAFVKLSAKYAIAIESPIPRLPDMTETILPFEPVSEFERFAQFFLARVSG